MNHCLQKRVAIWLISAGLSCSVFTAEPMNVLLIVVDDLNDWSDSFGGNVDAQMPNLDRLAAAGMKFNNAHCSAPACEPSRFSFMSGLLPSTTGLYTNNQDWFNNSRLAKVTYLNHYFRQYGYEAHATGKIYHGGVPNHDSAWDSEVSNRSSPKPPQEDRPLHGISDYAATSNFDWGVIANSKEDMAEWKSASRVISLLEDYETDPDPFFIACGFVNPHLPFYAPQEYFDRFPLEHISTPTVLADDLNDLPAMGLDFIGRIDDHNNVTSAGKWKEGVQGYLAASAVTDDAIGRVLDAIEAHPKRNNTIIVLVSDHGWHLGEKEHWRKFSLWENATRVPMVWIVPGVTSPGQVCDKPVSLLDLYPTLTEFCGLPANPENDGHSLAPLLANPSASWGNVAVTLHGYKNASVRDDRWRYIRYLDGTEELYDHNNDPDEWTNLAGNPTYQTMIEALAVHIPGAYAEPVDNRDKNDEYKFWKAANGAGDFEADTDGDLITDWNEFLAGLDPQVSDRDDSLQWAGAITVGPDQWDVHVTRDGSYTGAPPSFFSYDLETWYHGGEFANDTLTLPTRDDRGFVRFLQAEAPAVSSVVLSTTFDGVKYTSIDAVGLDSLTTGGSWTLNSERGATFSLDGNSVADLALLMDDEVNNSGDEFYARLDLDSALSLSEQSVRIDFSFLVRRFGAGKAVAFELRDASNVVCARFEYSGVTDRVYLNGVEVGSDPYSGGSNWGSAGQLANQRTLSLSIEDGNVTVDYEIYDGSGIAVATQALLGAAVDLKSIVILSAGATTSKEGVYLDDVKVTILP